MSTDALGRAPDSYGYHALDGKLWANGVECGQSFPYSDNTVVGCGYDLETQKIFYTLDGHLVGIAFANIAPAELFATVSVDSVNSKVTCNFGQRPFKYDHRLPKKLPRREDLSIGRSLNTGIIGRYQATDTSRQPGFVQSTGPLALRRKVIILHPLHTHTRSHTRSFSPGVLCFGGSV